MMQMELIETTNKKFSYLVGQEGDVRISGQVWFYTPFNEPFRTSDLQNIEYLWEKGSLMIVCNTLNSKYIFKGIL